MPSDEKPPERVAHWSPWWIAAAGLLVLVSWLWFAIRGRPGGPEDSTTKNAATLIVLCLENLGHPENDDFAAGITDDITGRLASVQGLAVNSPSTTLQYARTRSPLWAHGRVGLCRFMDTPYERLDF